MAGLTAMLEAVAVVSEVRCWRSFVRGLTGSVAKS